MLIMFWTIVGAILFVEVGLPLIVWLFSLMNEDGTVGCIIFGLVIIFAFAIFG